AKPPPISNAPSAAICPRRQASEEGYPMRPRTIVLVLALLALTAAGAYVAPSYLKQTMAPAQAAAAGTYQCAMHPQIVQDHPGICPICQMKLQRVDTPAPAGE